MTMTMTNLDQAADDTIHRISEYTDEQLANLARVFERGYIHVLIEQHLRAGANVAGVSQFDDGDGDSTVLEWT